MNVHRCTGQNFVNNLVYYLSFTDVEIVTKRCSFFFLICQIAYKKKNLISPQHFKPLLGWF